MSDLSNDLFAQAFASAPIGMVLVSIDSSSAGRFVEVNRAFCRMVGRSEEELLGMGLQSVTQPGTDSFVLRAGAGWREGLVGEAVFRPGRTPSPASASSSGSPCLSRTFGPRRA